MQYVHIHLVNEELFCGLAMPEPEPNSPLVVAPLLGESQNPLGGALVHALQALLRSSLMVFLGRTRPDRSRDWALFRLPSISKHATEDGVHTVEEKTKEQ